MKKKKKLHEALKAIGTKALLGLELLQCLIPIGTKKIKIEAEEEAKEELVEAVGIVEKMGIWLKTALKKKKSAALNVEKAGICQGNALILAKKRVTLVLSVEKVGICLENAQILLKKRLRLVLNVEKVDICLGNAQILLSLVEAESVLSVDRLDICLENAQILMKVVPEGREAEEEVEEKVAMMSHLLIRGEEILQETQAGETLIQEETQAGVGILIQEEIQAGAGILIL